MGAQQRCGIDITGALGELAVATVLGLGWAGSVVNPPKSWPDVWPDVQVRDRGNAAWDLPVRADDVMEHRYVLTLSHCYPTVRLVGWIWGHEAEDRGTWGNPWRNTPAWLVTQDRLRPWSEWE
jgi:hypothetical protein